MRYQIEITSARDGKVIVAGETDRLDDVLRLAQSCSNKYVHLDITETAPSDKVLAGQVAKEMMELVYYVEATRARGESWSVEKILATLRAGTSARLMND